MWRTPGGDRVLVGAEAELFRQAVRELVDALADPSRPHETGVAAFDRLTLGQRLSVLVEVAAALLDPGIPTPVHTAANEAAIAAVFENLAAPIGAEMAVAESTGRGARLQELVRRACSERDLQLVLPRPSPGDVGEWLPCLDALRDQVLWDVDYADEESFIDAAPGQAGCVYELMGVSRDYFTSVPPDPRDGEIEGLLQRLRELCRSTP